MTDTPPAPTAPDRDDGGGTWLKSFAELPSRIVQPFSLSAVALVAAVFLGIFGPLTASLSCIGVAVVLLAIGLWRFPRAGQGMGSDGPYTAVAEISAATPLASAGVDRDGIDGLKALEMLCFLHLYQLEGGSVGRNQVFPVNYFVDLMTAALIPDHREVMVRELAGHLRRAGDLSGTSTLAAPKRGNSLLLAGVAEELNLNPVFVKERPLFGKWLEGIGGQPRRAAIVDDISSDGELLVHCVNQMRDDGFEVTQAFVLIDRTEGDAVAALGEVGVSLLPVTRLGDAEIRRIVERARRSPNPQIGESS